MKALPLVIMIMMLTGFFTQSCNINQGFDDRLESIVAPYRFSTVSWEVKVLPREMVSFAQDFFRNKNEIAPVIEYFSTSEELENLERAIRGITDLDGDNESGPVEAEIARLQEIKSQLESTAEAIMEKQIKHTLAGQGIYNPLINDAKINFPPLNFELAKPPHLLVISPRDHIESLREIVLQQELSIEQMEAIEAKADALGVSALVVGLGGLGSTYPTFVTNEASLDFTINAATEEWLHQYLFFKPLGILYTLDLTGLSPNYEIATINETVASMTSKEIGALVIQEYYSQFQTQDGQNLTGGDFDFNREMREIRRTVEEYLAHGKIKLAEEYMEEKRQYLASMGYYIRKLNQAYFAFHGAYADSPTSISPIGSELKTLREESSSIKDFLEKASLITSREDLKQAIQSFTYP